jgi:hypothetical protein
MSFGTAPACAIAVALVATLAGCGSATHPAGGRGVVDSPITTKTNHLTCLRQQRLPVQVTSATTLQIGPLPNGPTVEFLPTPGAAQALQIIGVRANQGAEVIGGAQLYPNGASDGELKQIETCLAKGVSG